MALDSLMPTTLVVHAPGPVNLVGAPLNSVCAWTVPRPAITRRLVDRVTATVLRVHPYLWRWRLAGGPRWLRDVIDRVGARVVIAEFPFYPFIVADLRGMNVAVIADVVDDRVKVARESLEHASGITTRVSLLLGLPALVRSERHLELVDQVWFASLGDARRVIRPEHPPYVIVPNVIDTPVGRQELSPHPLSAAFLGSFDYPPNEAAAVRFASRIAPRVRAREPNSRFVLIGRQPTPSIRRVADQNSVLLWADVPNAADALARCMVLVVPLSTGGGTRLKVLEAMSTGVPVVSTALGVAGLDLEPGRHYLGGETDDDLASAVLRCWRDEDLRRRLIVNGRELVATRFGRPALDTALVAAMGGLGISLPSGFVDPSIAGSSALVD
jgi:glycosyltransferase involved in cell wall biosynthesis